MILGKLTGRIIFWGVLEIGLFGSSSLLLNFRVEVIRIYINSYKFFFLIGLLGG